MIRLALAHMRDRPMPVALNALLIGFAGALLLALASLSHHLTTRFDRDMAGVDLVVSAKGSPLQVILSSLLHVDIPTGNIPYDAASALSKDPLVSQAIPIAIGDRFRGYRVVGTTAEYLKLYGARPAQGSIDVGDEQAVIGASAAQALGITVGQQFAVTHGIAGEDGSAHDAHPLTAGAILAPTGSVVDRLILTSLEAVWEAHGIHADDEDDQHDDDHHGEEHDHEGEEEHEHDEAHEHAEDGRAPEITALLLRYASPLAAVRLPQKINQQSQLMAAVPAYETARLLSLFGATEQAAQALTAALALLGAFAIFAALWSALEQREDDLAHYRLLGAQPRHIFTILLLEGAITAMIGAGLAWLIARVFLWRLSEAVPSLAESGLALFRTTPAEWAILMGMVCLGALAALPAGVKAARTSLERVLSA